MANKNYEKQSFVMYDSFLSAMKHLNDVEFRECTLRIRDYALEGIDEESESPNINIIMELVKPNLDAARRRYMASVENGKKGAEFGKLGGAPRGNQNARKKQPLNQPLEQPFDVNDYVDVKEDDNEKVNEEVNVNGDAPLGSMGFNSSFSNSSIVFLEKGIVNNSERLEEREEKKAPLQEDNKLHSNNWEVVADSKGKEAPLLYSKSDNSNSTIDSPSSGLNKECSAVRPRRRTVKSGEYNQGEYYQLCLNNFVLDLADMRMGILPNEDGLFWRAVNLYQSLYNLDKEQAIKAISSKVSEIVRQHT